MNLDSSKERFLERLNTAGLSLEALTLAAGIEALLAYYEGERAGGCEPGSDGDVLLFPWGTDDWGGQDGPSFEVSIVRQLVATDDPEEEPRQLNRCVRYEPAVGNAAGEGASSWCASPEGLAEFRRFVAGSEVLKAAGQVPPKSISLRLERT